MFRFQHLRKSSAILLLTGLLSPPGYADDIDQLVILADSLREEGNYAVAMDTYRKAQHYIHLNHGVHATEQIPILNKITNMYLGEGDRTAADREQEFAFTVGTRQTNQSIIYHLGAYENLAQYYMQFGDLKRVFDIYEDEIDFIKGLDDADSTYLYHPMKGIASAALQMGHHESRGIRALEELIPILASTEHNLDQLSVQVLLADLYLIRSDYKKAAVLYKSIWQNTEDLSLLEPFFSEPTLLFPHDVETPFLYDRESSEFVDISVDVNIQGRISDVNIENSNLSILQRSKIHLWLRYNRYRPRMIDGEFIPSEGLTVEHLIANAPGN